MNDNFKCYMVIFGISWLVLCGCSGCAGTWVGTDSGNSAYRARLLNQSQGYVPSDIESNHKWGRGEITDKEFNDHRMLRGEGEINFSNPYSPNPPKVEEHESFLGWLFRAILPATF